MRIFWYVWIHSLQTVWESLYYSIIAIPNQLHSLLLLSFLFLQTTIGTRALLGDQSTSVLRDAAQSVIEALKDQHIRDPERHETISRLLTNKKASSPGGISSEQFAKLVQLGKKLDDYEDNLKQQSSNTEGGAGEDQVDDEMGVAVVFDEDEDDGEGGDKGDDSDAEEDVVVEAVGARGAEGGAGDAEGVDGLLMLHLDGHGASPAR